MSTIGQSNPVGSQPMQTMTPAANAAQTPHPTTDTPGAIAAHTLSSAPANPSHATLKLTEQRQASVLTPDHKGDLSSRYKAKAAALKDEITALSQTRANLQSELAKLGDNPPEDRRAQLEGGIKALDQQIADKQMSRTGKQLLRFLTDKKTVFVAGGAFAALGVALVPVTFGASALLLTPGVAMMAYAGDKMLNDKGAQDPALADEALATPPQPPVTEGPHLQPAPTPTRSLHSPETDRTEEEELEGETEDETENDFEVEIQNKPISGNDTVQITPQTAKSLSSSTSIESDTPHTDAHTDSPVNESISKNNKINEDEF